MAHRTKGDAMTVVRYDKAGGCSGGPTPGAIALRDHWRKVTGLGDMGIYNCRPPRGGTGWSVHAEGRAVDLAADALFTAEREIADRYCQFLIDNAGRLACQYLIWNRRSWKSGRGWGRYGGQSPHIDHIHAELNRDGARDVTVALLDALWSEWTADHAQEDEIVFTVAEAADYVRDAYRYIVEREATDGEVYLWAHAIADDAREMWKMQQRLVGEALRAR